MGDLSIRNYMVPERFARLMELNQQGNDLLFTSWVILFNNQNANLCPVCFKNFGIKSFPPGDLSLETLSDAYNGAPLLVPCKSNRGTACWAAFLPSSALDKTGCFVKNESGAAGSQLRTKTRTRDGYVEMRCNRGDGAGYKYELLSSDKLQRGKGKEKVGITVSEWTGFKSFESLVASISSKVPFPRLDFDGG
jgi:hypothetical protein